LGILRDRRPRSPEVEQPGSFKAEINSARKVPDGQARLLKRVSAISILIAITKAKETKRFVREPRRHPALHVRHLSRKPHKTF
jgi:hypothetical protein